jgi:beta-glucosidase
MRSRGGLSYTRFTYTGLELDTSRVTAGGSIRATVTVRHSGEEIVQMYLAPNDA